MTRSELFETERLAISAKSRRAARDAQGYQPSLDYTEQPEIDFDSVTEDDN